MLHEADKQAEIEAQKGKKTIIRGKRRCQRCGELGHGQISYKCPLNGTKKRTRKPKKIQQSMVKMQKFQQREQRREQLLRVLQMTKKMHLQLLQLFLMLPMIKKFQQPQMLLMTKKFQQPLIHSQAPQGSQKSRSYKTVPIG